VLKQLVLHASSRDIESRRVCDFESNVPDHPALWEIKQSAFTGGCRMQKEHRDPLKHDRNEYDSTNTAKISLHYLVMRI